MLGLWLLTAGHRYMQVALLVDDHLLFLGRVQDLENLTAQSIVFQTTFLEHFFDVSELTKVKLTLAVQRVVVHFQFLDYLIFLTAFVHGRHV